MTHHPNPPPPPPFPDTYLPVNPQGSQSKRSRRWPWILGLIGALAAGGAIGYGGTPEPEVVTKEVEVEVEVEPSDMDERRAELDQQEDDLDDRTSELEERDEELESLASELDEREGSITATATEIEENTIPGSGVFLVGEDIQPGTYSTEGSSCYWARLSGVSGDFDDIISNGNLDGPGYVTIAESDSAFETTRCGEWTLQ